MGLLRKPRKNGRRQGLKILVYGVDGSGKSLFGLGFPRLAVIDAESKLGVYEGTERGKNIIAVADTSNYYDSLEVVNEVIASGECESLMIDSETYIYEGMQVACMEVEEERAKKKKGNIDDQIVSQRGYGKIKLNASRLKLLKAQASAKGVTIISTAHKEDIMQKVGENNIKVGEKPSLRKNSNHDFDVILRFYKEKDLATGEYKFFAEVEKDTTETLKLGSIVENPSYDLFKNYIENNNKLEIIETNYDKTIENNMETMENEAKDFDTLVEEFETIFKKLKEQDKENITKVKGLLTKYKVDSYKKPENFDGLKEVVAELKKIA